MTDYRAVLKKVGVAWIAYGLADIACLIYSATQGHDYSSSLLAPILGLFLWRGSLGASTFATWLCAFLLVAGIGAVLMIPFLQPMGLLLIHARLDPVGTTILWIMALATLVLLAWSYKHLRSPTVLEARKASGRSTATPKAAIGLGIGLVAFLSIMLATKFHGATGEKAVALARQQLGPDYRYATQSFSMNDGHTSAVVAAYRDDEIKYVSVEWNE